MADPPPLHFIPRPAEFDALIQRLMADGNHNVAITAALRGAGGYGKTTLAKAICHDPRVQAAFPDGTLWTTLGQTPGNLVTQVEDLIKYITGANSGFNNAEAVFHHFRELLAERRMLMVIDDVWDHDHLRPFVQGGPNVARLITTRNLDTIASYVERENQVTVDAMRLAEAARMLHTKLPAGCDDEFEALAERLGCWPFLLCLANGALRERTAEPESESSEPEGESLEEALAFICDNLEENGLFAFDAEKATKRDHAVRTMLGVSFRLLSDAELDRFHELAIFPEDALVPLATVERLWSKSGGMSRVAADKLYSRLYNLSLLLNLNRQTKTKTLQLHDITRKYLIAERKSRLAAIQNQLLDAHRPPESWAELPDNEPYFWDHLAEHLIEAGRGDELVATVKDWRYLAKKTWLKESLSVEGDLVKAETFAPADDSLRTLRRNYVNSGHLFNHCATRKEVNETLFARLQHLDELKTILRDMVQSLRPPRLAPLFTLPDLPHPALIRTLEGHSSSVSGCAFSLDGKLIVSASSDRKLKVWEAQTGALRLTLDGHSSPVNGCAFSPDGKMIVSASRDRTLKVWEAQTGALRLTLEGHSDSVSGCAFSPDGKLIVSASEDRMLKVWETQTGALRLTLEGHSHWVNGCAFSPDGKLIVSASNDGTLKVWQAQTGAPQLSPEGHSDSVSGCAFSPDGKLIVTASWDHTLKVWEAQTGALRLTLKGHSSPVNGCAFSPDGKMIVSASWDRRVKFWEAQTGALQLTLEGHSSSTNGFAFSSDGILIVSASSYSTLKVWEARTGALRLKLKGHSDVVNGCAFSPDGKMIVSASRDDTLKVWEVQTGKLQFTLEGHSHWVQGCVFSPDGRLIVSASDDGTLKVWEAQTGELRFTLNGHSAWVRGCAFSPDGKMIVSASWDRTLKVWGAQTGECVATFYADGPISCCAVYGEMIAAGGARGLYFLRLVQ